jgi:16S rRNA (cytosine967-C5)-methyltransferase
MWWMVLHSVDAVTTLKLTQQSNPRVSAAHILQQVLAGRSLSDAAPRFLEKLVDPRDRGLTQELCYGVMRWYPQLDWLLGQLLNKPLKPKDRDISALLLIGLYQLRYLRVADHAAVHETAGAANKLRKHWAVGLINGVLREFQRRQDVLLERQAADPEASAAMPLWLLERIQRRWPEQWQKQLTALNCRPPMSLRVNQKIISRNDYLLRLQVAGITARAITATACGVELEQPVDVERLPGFQQGMVSVQDGGAQLAAELLELQPEQWVLDACAAPGGKTGHLLEAAANLRVTAMDVDQKRLVKVKENLQRLSLEAEVVQGDASQPVGKWAERQYDRILLDVPCSATGVMRRHPDIKYLRRPEDVAALVKQQARILRVIWPLLKPTGLLLYATCSILPEENERQLVAFLQQTLDARESSLDVAWGEARSVGRQIAPGMSNMDGFYYARLVKIAA